MKSLMAILFSLICFWSMCLAQTHTARLTIEPISGYTFPSTINPTLQTFPAIQSLGTLTADATDIRIFASSNPQSEVHASISNANPQVILFSSNTNFGLSSNSNQGWYMSTNGGQSWFGSDTLPNNGLGRGDPSTAFDARGYAYIASMGPNATGDPDGYMVQRSTNAGGGWSVSKRGAGPTSGFDKEMIAVDNISSSPYANRFYCSWTEFIGGTDLSHAFVKSNRSTDGGQTFSIPDTLRQSNNGTGGGQGACLATGPNGEVYICWADYSTGSAPADGMGFGKSTDGASSFTTKTAFAYQGIRMNGTDPRFNNTRVNDFPSIAVDKSSGANKGRIYIAYPNGGNGLSDRSVIQIRYSTDGGSSWSSAQTISTSNGRQNWFPWVAVDDVTGDVSVIYYSLDSPSGFSTNTYVAHSSNGGSNWENIKVSDVSHTTAPIPGFINGYAGDYIGICGSGRKQYPVWMDDRNGTWQLYTSPISYPIYVPEQFPDLASALSVAVSGQTVIVSGTQTVSGSLTVNSGVTLQLNAGSNILFSSGTSRLLIYGTLSANGTSATHVTLNGQGYTRSGYVWAMIVLTSGANANIQYADFKNAGYQLTISQNTGTVSVQNCSFANFGMTTISDAIHIFSKNSGSATISSNVITGSNSQGTGIYCSSTGTNVTISNNTISSAGIGIRCYSSSAYLTANTIRNQSNYGIQADNVSAYAQYRTNDIRSCGYGMFLNSSTPWVMQNVIIQNGLNVLVNSCTPNFATQPGEGDNMHGHNVIAHAGSPLLKVQNYAAPYFGYGYNGGYNSIFDSDLPDAWVMNNSGLDADNNYWTDGGSPACYVDGTSWALTRYPLSLNPNPDPLGKTEFVDNVNPRNGVGLLKTGVTTADTIYASDFRSAIEAAVNGDISSATTDLMKLINTPSQKYAALALLYLHDIAQGKWNYNDTTGKLKSEFKQVADRILSKDGPAQVRPFALHLLARDAAASGDDTLAILYRTQILKDYPGSSLELNSLYDLILYYAESKGDLKTAAGYLSRMKEAFPEENLTFAARIELGENVDLPEGRSKPPGVAPSQITATSLGEAYPNPFNPTTTIRYRLSSDGRVSLKVYDAIGREVATLVNEYQTAGVHQVQFNGQNFASGVYFYRLTAGNSTQIKKMLMIK